MMLNAMSMSMLMSITDQHVFEKKDIVLPTHHPDICAKN